MMGKIKFLKEDLISTLKLSQNANKIIELVNNNDTNEWLKEFYKEPFIDSNLEVDLMDLKMDKEKAFDTDFENSKILFNMFSKFADAETCNEDFWVSLEFGKYYSFMKYRWPLTKESNLNNHWLFGSNKKRSLLNNGLGRLYWFAKYTYDETLENPFEITEFCFEDVNTFNELIYRSFTNSKHVRLALLKALKQYKETYKKLGMGIIRFAVIYVNFLGGSYILDSFTQSELQEKIYKKLLMYREGLNQNQDNTFKL